MIGDSIRDMELAWNAGANAVLVLTGYGEETSHHPLLSLFWIWFLGGSTGFPVTPPGMTG